MKRKKQRDSKNKARTGDIKRDISVDQRAALGAAALAYNDVEKYIEGLFFIVTDLPGPMQYEVSTRITSIAAKVDIVLAGADYLGLDPQDRTQLGEALGEGIFGKLKGYRNAVIHARILDASTGIGLSVENRANLQEVLLTVTALEALYINLVALAKELSWFGNILGCLRSIKKHAPNIGSVSEGIARWTVRVRALQIERKTLPPIPEFPPESELDAAEIRWLQALQSEQMGSYQQFSQSVQMPQKFSNALWDALAKEEQQKK
jgi:hypothetical protein